MYRVEVWIDVVCREGNRSEPVCTLFTDTEMPMRPLAGESLSFYQAKGSALEFELVSAIGVSRQSSVAVTVEDVRHYAVKSDDGVVFKTAVHCTEIPVASKNDARTVCTFMTTQLGFAVDPYGVNELAD